tara:strand:+ start:172 stop:786 length:615 start_codon:yes stop_codon:yes gene_type:complete
MCYSLKASIGAFIFNLTICFILYNRNKGNDIPISIILFGVSLIQFAEIFMHLDTNCNSKINIFGSKLGYIILTFLQPFFSILSTIYLTKQIFNKKVIFHIIIWFIFICYNILNHWPNKLCSRTEKCENNICKLNWEWHSTSIIHNILYSFVILGIPIMYYKKDRFIWTFYVIISALAIWNSKYFSTLWCFWGPLIALILQYYLK